jgi:transcriptional regulator with XRE-family HTH domain
LQPLDAERVREWRHRRMLSQQEVADRAGTSLFTIQRIERGEGNVRPKTGRGVAAALGVPIEELLPKAQAPLFREPPEQEPAEERREHQRAAAVRDALEDLRRTAIRFEGYHAIQKAIDEYREQWEKRLAEGDFDKAALEEAGRALKAFWPAVTAAADAEMIEGTQWGAQPEKTAEQSVLLPAIARYQALCKRVDAIYREKYEPAATVYVFPQREAS